MFSQFYNSIRLTIFKETSFMLLTSTTTGARDKTIFFITKISENFKHKHTIFKYVFNFINLIANFIELNEYMKEFKSESLYDKQK